jgi:hypothetical protein
MATNPSLEKKDFSVDVASLGKDVNSPPESGSISDIIYVDPDKEKAAFRKFDRYTVPASFVFMLLCALDRNNVSLHRPWVIFRTDTDDPCSWVMPESSGSTRISTSRIDSLATSTPSPP